MTTLERKTLTVLLALALAGACAKKAPEPAAGPGAPDEAGLSAAFTAGVAAYLDRRGDLCIDRSSWPVDVSEAEPDRGTRDARQMPVLERLGVVEGRAAVVRVAGEDGARPVPVRRYQLTALGRRSFLDRRTRLPLAAEEKDTSHADLCVARLTLDKVVAWELRPGADGAPATSAVVSYTYDVEPAPWMHDPEAQRVFPAVARVLAGAHAAALTEGFTLVGGAWIANELVPSAAAPAAVAARAAAPSGAGP